MTILLRLLARGTCHVFLVILASLPASVYGQACPAGQYRSGSCTNCPAGTFGATAGATALVDCVICWVGTFSSAGASVCTACTGGFNSPAGSSACSTAYPVYALVTDWTGGAVRKLDVATSSVDPVASSLDSPGGVTVARVGGFALFPSFAFNRIYRINLASRDVSVLAGSGSAGSANAVGASASFNGPVGVKISPDGTYALCVELTAHAVRRIRLSDSSVTRIAGTLSIGFSDGTGTLIAFNAPAGIDISSDGSFALVSEFDGNRIRRLALGGADVTSSLVAGEGGKNAGTAGTGGGVGDAARFTNPQGIAISSDMTFALVADRGSNTIRKIVLSSRTVSTLATIAGAGPLGIALAGLEDYALVTGYAGNRVYRVTHPGGTVTTFAGDGVARVRDNAVGIQASFNEPQGISLWHCSLLGYGMSSTSASCAQCPTGTFGSGDGRCMSCPAMTFSSPGASQCTPCPATNGSGVGAAVCCARNEYLPVGTSTCRACPDNSWSIFGATGICVPSPGYFYPEYGTTTNLANRGAFSSGTRQFLRFTSAATGTFSFSQTISAQVLVVGGGGSGGVRHNGGGGSGALIHTTSSFTSGLSYTVTCGTGGASATTTPGTTRNGDAGSQSTVMQGSTTLFRALGGGGGGGVAGGSSGGRGAGTYTATSVDTANAPVGAYGNSGGIGSDPAANSCGSAEICYAGGGGGGAGGAGSGAINFVSGATCAVGGAGGAGTVLSITGSPVVYAGGGGGGTFGCSTRALGGGAVVSGSFVEVGGKGGSNEAANVQGGAAAANTGSGGGSSGSGWAASGAGSGGVVVIAFDSPITTQCPSPAIACTGSQTRRCTPTGDIVVCCGAGTFFVEGTDSTCQACPAGTFSLNGAQTACTRCAAANTYSTTNNAATCTNCPVDSGTPLSTGLCVVHNPGTCPAGTYVSSGTCFACPAGKFSATAGAASCTACPDNTGSSAGAAGCVPSAGFYLASSATRFPSSAMTGVTINIGGEVFEASDSSHYVSGIWSSPAFQVFNSADDEWSSSTSSYGGTGGTYNGGDGFSTVVDGVTYAGEWIELRTGVARQLNSYSIGARNYGTLYRRSPTRFVIAGKNGDSPWITIDTQTDITWTSAGQTRSFTPSLSIFRSFDTFRLIYLRVDPSGDQKAGIDEWSLFAGTPTACASGSCTSPTPNRQCTLTGGTVCCGTGTYWIPSATNAGCTPCPVGTYGDGSGTSCTACDVGKFAGVTGLSTCQNCAAGTTSQPGAAMCFTPAISACLNGQYLQGTTCTPCPTGTYGNGTSLTSLSQCIPCEAGTYGTGLGFQTPTNCTGCAAGTYGTGLGFATITNCTACAAGTYATGLGFASISNCTACAAGTYGTGLGFASISHCTGCAAGTFSQSTGVTSNSTCVACGVGTYAGSAGSSACSTCPPNSNTTAPAIGASKCTANPGFYFAPTFLSTIVGNATITSMTPGSYLAFNRNPNVWVSNSDGGPIDVQSVAGQTSVTQYGQTLATDNSYPIVVDGTGNVVVPYRWYKFDLNTCFFDSGKNSTPAIPKRDFTCSDTKSSVRLTPPIFAVKGSGAALYDSHEQSAVFTQLNNLRTMQQTTGFTMAFWSNMYVSSSGSTILSIVAMASTTRSHTSEPNIVVWKDTSASNIRLVTSVSGGVRTMLETQAIDRKWKHYAFTVTTSGEWTIWIDGSRYSCPSGCAITSPTIPIPVSTTNEYDISFGVFSGYDGLINKMTGGTDDFRVYDTVLSSSQIFELYAGSVSVYTVTVASCTSTTCQANTYLRCTPSGEPVCCKGGEYFLEGTSTACQPCPQGSSSDGSGSACFSCAPGQSVTGLSTCTACTAGTYSDNGGQSQCTQCPAGTYSVNLSAVSSGTCQSCPRGTFQPNPGASNVSNCSSCFAGTYQPVWSANSSSQCIGCPAGKYFTGTGLHFDHQCYNCGPGYYCTALGLPSYSGAQTCNPGTYSTGFGLTNSTQCTLCHPGTYSNIVARTTPCILCSAGTFSTALGLNSSAGCMLCSAGMYSTVSGGNISSVCQGCPTGTYGTGVGVESISNCTACAAGTYGTGTGFPAITNCTACSAGQFSPNTGAISSLVCQNCLAGTYGTGTGFPSAANCTLCGTGDFSTALGAVSISTCQDCRAGTYGTGTGFPAPANCTPCAAGLYSTIPGANHSATCQNCTAGTYGTGTGFPALSNCTSCSPGQFSPVLGATTSATCQNCSAGTYGTGTGFPAAANCTACSLGQFSTASGAVSNTTCRLCPGGTFSNRTGLATVASCTNCMAGTFSTTLGAIVVSTCSFCARGTYTGPGSTNCTACPPSSNTTTSGSTQRGDCICNSGAFGDLSNPTSTCGTCPPNFFCGGQLQTPCPNGTLSFTGATQVSQCGCQANATILPALGLGCTCDRGFRRNYNPSALGEFDCQPCTGGSTYCYLGVQYACPANSLAANLSSNLTDCKCNPGFYWNASLSACPQCPADFYCSENTLYPCPANTNSPPQSSLQTHCICQGGYKCTLVRDYRLVIKFQLTLAQFNAQEAAIRTSIAQSAGVPESRVVIQSLTQSPARRLLEYSPTGIEDDTMHVSVYVPLNHDPHSDLMVLA